MNYIAVCVVSSVERVTIFLSAPRVLHVLLVYKRLIGDFSL